MSLKSYNEISTELNSSNGAKINESLLNNINQIFKIVLEKNEKLKNYSDKLNSQKKNDCCYFFRLILFNKIKPPNIYKKVY